MTPENAKEMKYIFIFISILSIVVLGSYLTDHNILDLAYLFFIATCLIRYLFICFRS